MTNSTPCLFARITDPSQWEDMASRVVSAELDGAVGRTIIQLHRNHKCSCNFEATPTLTPQETAVPTQKPLPAPKRTLHADGTVEFTDAVTDSPAAGNLGFAFEWFNMDPAEYEIVGGTVKSSAWNNGTYDENDELVKLYSHRATFRPILKTDDSHFESLVSHIRGFAPVPPAQAANTTTPVTAVISLADWQLGKGEGDGTKGTIDRIKSALNSTIAYIEDINAAGHHQVTQILLANLGDHIEAVQGSYANQLATVDLNLRDQINLAIELNILWITEMRRLAPVHYASAICNHGQWQRSPGSHDSASGDADNATGFIADQLELICKYAPGLADVTFTTPVDEMITTGTFSGVNIAMAHGHKISGKEETWLATQSQTLTHKKRFIPDLWLTAHKHHANIIDLGPYTRIQATTSDPGSKWLYDAKGVYSTPGTTVFLASETFPMKWDQYRVLN